MARLAAFVGHSFRSADDDVTSRILRMLTNIANLMEDFTWEHALPAEPKALSEKVREKIKGKNLFIGICTANEAAIGFDSLRNRNWLGRVEVVATQAKVQQKTSDWILQEIGMAVGREMDIILLLEEGVREPGGLQGDLEFISFNRSEPEKCFDKLVNMLRTLSPKAKAAPDANEPTSSSESAGSPIGDELVGAMLTPDDSWSARRYVTRIEWAIASQDQIHEDQIVADFAASKFAAEVSSSAAFDAARISARANHYKAPWLKPLQDLAAKYPREPEPLARLAEQFALSDEHDRAAELYEKAVDLIRGPTDKIEMLVLAAGEHHKAKKPAKAEAILSTCAAVIRNNAIAEPYGMEQLAGSWKELGNDELFFACAERCLEMAPDRTQVRFDLAYRYSEVGHKADALFHYRHYVRSTDDASGWNNLGATASALKLPITSVSAYKTSEDGNNTLAMSNLAYAYLGAGFVDEAIAKCNEGLKRSESDPRVIDALAECSGAREKEDKNEKGILDKTSAMRNFRQTIGSACVLLNESPIPTKWIGPKCELSATQKDSELRLVGTYEQPKYSGVVRALTRYKGPDEMETVNVEYVGRLFGRAFIGTIKTTSPSAKKSVLSIADLGDEFRGTIDVAANRITICEKEKEPYFLTAQQ